LSARTKARKRAVDAVYAADLRDLNPIDLLEDTAESVADRQNQETIFGYAYQIVAGIVDEQTRIDTAIENASHEWKLDRMPALDRAILRVAAWELLFNSEVPTAVAIAEAVEIGQEYSTEDSSRFINGVLSQIAATRTAL